MFAHRQTSRFTISPTTNNNHTRHAFHLLLSISRDYCAIDSPFRLNRTSYCFNCPRIIASTSAPPPAIPSYNPCQRAFQIIGVTTRFDYSRFPAPHIINIATDSEQLYPINSSSLVTLQGHDSEENQLIKSDLWVLFCLLISHQQD